MREQGQHTRANAPAAAHKALATRVAAVALWLAVWQLASWAFAQPLLLPGPVEVLCALARNAALPSFWGAVGFSAARILGGLALAFLVAIPLAALAHRSRAAAAVLDVPFQVVKATPVVCVVVLLLLWLGSANVSAVAVFLMAAPGFYFPVREGFSHQDVRMVELFDVHGISGVCRALALTWQQVLPYVLAAAQSVVGMAWKAGVAAELIGVPLGSIGERIYQAKLLIETADVLAWTAAIIVFAALSEHILVAALRASGPVAVRLAIRLRGHRSDAGDVSVGDSEGSMAHTGANGTPNAAEPIIEFMNVQLPFGSGAAGSKGEAAAMDGSAGPDNFMSFTLHAGERRCLTTPSGSGKTTLLRVAAGSLEPAAGTVVRPTCLSMMFQESRLIEGASALQNVLLFASPQIGEADVTKMLTDLIPGIVPYAPVNELSGGQRRRVELVRTLAAPGSAVLLDEPFAGLDAASQRAAEAFIDAHLGDRALIIATHI